jgi:hypothetical protein
MKRSLAALALVSVVAAPAAARPTYFEVLTQTFDLQPGDALYACGVCHYRWTGTGARNLFGTSVEQELYLGKTITQAIADAVPGDPDGDGFASLDELTTHQTLPGYSCTNFFDAIGAPADWHSFITPNVVSCLEPKDVRLAPANLVYTTETNTVESQTVTIFNNGADFPIEVTSVALAAGAPGTFSIDAPAVPFELAVGETAAVAVTFAPTGPDSVSTTLRVVSDDPDEPALDVAIVATAFQRPLAQAPRRAACLADLDRAVRRYTKTQLLETTRCATDEARGRACRAGARDVALLRAEAKLLPVFGGAKDRACAAGGLSPTLIGQDDRCGEGCDTIRLVTFPDLAECLVCRQQEVSDGLVAALLGAAPPDRPGIAETAPAGRCAAAITAGARKLVAKSQDLLSRCRLANVTAAEPVDCAVETAAAREALRADLARRFERCADTAGLAGCFEGGADPACLGDAADAAAQTLVEDLF